MLIPRKSHSQVSIQTLDFARIRTFYWRDLSWIAGVGVRGGRLPAGPRRHSWPMWGPHRSIDIAGSGAPETSQNGRGRGLQGARPGKCNGRSAPRWRTGNRCPPPSDAARQSVDVTGGWACETACSGRVSGATAHLSKRGSAARRGMRSPTGSRTPGTGDPRPAVGRSQTIS